MNALPMRSDTDLRYTGRINEDVNAYVTHGARGDLFLTVMRLQMNQTDTQMSPWRADGTLPGARDVHEIVLHGDDGPVVYRGPDQSTNGPGQARRLHHSDFDWETAVPKVVSDRYGKVAARA